MLLYYSYPIDFEEHVCLPPFLSPLLDLYVFTLQIDSDENSQDKDLDDFGEDATQLDLDALEELERRNNNNNNNKPHKRGRIEEDSYGSGSSGGSSNSSNNGNMDDKKRSRSGMNMNNNNGNTGNEKAVFKAPHPLLPSNSGILINPTELEYVRTIGVGSCGEVSEYTWRGTTVAGISIFPYLYFHTYISLYLYSSINQSLFIFHYYNPLSLSN